MTTRDRKKKFGSTIWSIDNPRKGPIDCYIKIESQDKIAVLFRESELMFTGASIPRRKARLLAKRINECLDKTQ